MPSTAPYPAALIAMSSVSSTSVRPSGRGAENVRQQLVAPVQQTRQHGDHFTTVTVTSIRITSPVTGSVAAIDWPVS